MRMKFCCWLTLMPFVLGTTGCGSFIARRMAQAPNTYPSWLAPVAPVTLAFADNLIPNFPAHFVEVGPPAAKLRYRIVEPADYHFSYSSTNWMRRCRAQFKFSMHADWPAKSNAWTASPRGTVVLLHGYGVAQFAMAPWALRLAQEGWRCVLVDLRGHGKSTGRQIFFGVREVDDLSQLLDALARDGQLVRPVGAMGESYGAALALRWKAVEARVDRVVAIAPYANLSNAVLNISHEYAGWFPPCLLKAGLRKLPSVLNVEAKQLDTATALSASPVAALFVAAKDDRITPLADVLELQHVAASGSQLVEVSGATHEAVTYCFTELTQPVLAWLAGGGKPASGEP